LAESRELRLGQTLQPTSVSPQSVSRRATTARPLAIDCIARRDPAKLAESDPNVAACTPRVNRVSCRSS
jgi:hypothetical protein